MLRRWTAWLVVLVALTAMATLGLADRKERIPRDPPTVRYHAPSQSGSSQSGSSSNVTGGGS